MNIKERNQKIAQHTDIVTFGGKKLQKQKSLDVAVYWNNLTRPPIRAYIADWVVQRLYDYMTSPRLINNPAQRFKLTNELLEPWGFKPLASGTNRRAFYCVYDPGIIFKIASDAVGQKDNQSEVTIQQMLRPFCPKIFDVAGDGVIALSERGEPMTEHDYKFVWAEEIFDLLFSLLARGYILEDVGSNFYKNFGIRMGFGPMLWDFPYVYKLDWRKLICTKPDPITGQPCGGEIDYDYHKGMSEIVCTRCSARYSAKYLASAMPSEAFTSINRKGGFTMGRFDTNFQVSVRQGDKTVAQYGTETRGQKPQGGNRRRRTLRNDEQYTPGLPGVVTEATSGIMQPTSPQAAAIAQTAIQNGMVMSPSVVQGINQTYSPNQAVEATVTTFTKQDVVQNVVAPYGAIPGQQMPNYTISPVQPTHQQTPTQQAFPQQQVPQNGRAYTEPYRDPNSPAYRHDIPGQVVAAPPIIPKRNMVQSNGQMGITLTPEEFLALIANCQASGKEVPIALIQAAPELAATMMQNKPEPEYTQPIKTVGPVKDFDHYYEGGKRLFKYPQALKNQIIGWLNRIQSKFSSEVAVLLAEKLEINFDPNRNSSDPKSPIQPPPTTQTAKPKAPVISNGKKTYPKITPGSSTMTQSRQQPKATQHPAQANYAGVHQMVQQPNTETVIAPKAERRVLEVEDQSNWKQRNGINQPQQTTTNQQAKGQLVQTTGLFPVEPMSMEAKDAADSKANHDNAIFGFPGVPAVDTMRFKTEIPKVKKAVEARFNDFPLSLDEADRQTMEMAAKIKDFIRNDVASIMNTDDKGLEVTVVRTTDHRNADCFSVNVTNYSSPVFMTVLYPNNDKVDQELEDTMQQTQVPIEPEEQELPIPQGELEALFEQGVQRFDASNCNSEEEVRTALINHLFSILVDTYQGQITVPRAYKEAAAYVDQAVQIKAPEAQQQEQQTQSKATPQRKANDVVPPQPQPQMAQGSVGAAL